MAQYGEQFLMLLHHEAGEGGVVGDVEVVVLLAQPGDADDVALQLGDAAYLVSVEFLERKREKKEGETKR